MSRWRNLLFHAAERFVDYFFRRPSWPARLLGTGVTLIIGGLGIGSLTGDLTWLSEGGMFRVAIDTSGGGLSLHWSQAAFLIGLVFAVVGGSFGVADHVSDRRQLRRQRVLVMEHRGLHQTVDTPLTEAVPKNLKGHIDAMPVDHRQSTATSQISSPEDALSQIAGLRQLLRQKRDAAGPGNVKVVYGGMAPVPLTFLTGMMIDNEADLTVMDWDRFESRWRQLDGPDDGDRFIITGLEELPANATEVALAIAVSYPSDIDGIRSTLSDMPLIRAALSNPSTASHWSAEKQAAMAKDFTDLLGDLMAKGIKRIHLFIAAPNSVVFNLGRHFDDRMHPDAAVYQYERSATPPFPWAVELPTHGNRSARIVRA